MNNWIKSNKLLTVVLVVVAYFAFQLSRTFFGINTLSLNTPSTRNTYDGLSVSENAMMGAPSAGVSNKIGLPVIPDRDYAPQADATNRLVIQESNLSLLVKDVVEVRNKILEFTNSKGGYMVNASTSNPQDKPTGTVVIRIPSDKLQESLDHFHSLSIKVVSENLIGTDVTDRYVDIDKRISQIESTMTRLEEILDSATEVSDITNLTQQILYYQEQIDSLRCQQQSLEKNAELAKLTIYLSTDEIALPYTPSDTFRPQIIFKLAVRSLVSSLRDFAELAIWAGVYSVIWIPALLLYIFIRKWWKQKYGDYKPAK
jgi:hypothetical protein